MLCMIFLSFYVHLLVSVIISIGFLENFVFFVYNFVLT
jgi:hypothetical protein